MRALQLFHWKSVRLSCSNFLKRVATKWRLSCEEIPQRDAERVDIGACINHQLAIFSELLRTGERGCSDKSGLGFAQCVRLRSDNSGNAVVDYFDDEVTARV